MFRPVSVYRIVGAEGRRARAVFGGAHTRARADQRRHRVLEGPSSALGLQSDLKLASHHSPLAGDIVLAYGTAKVDPDGDEALLAALTSGWRYVARAAAEPSGFGRLPAVASDLIAEARSSGEAEGVVLMFASHRRV